ncbi:hypothetical protein GOODEAATRI_003456 [Goodea atripinnis]|uniref:Uncharacterized protein n=1 Tax=Goodea atripinnis TaxID=208336 RepID=A0ABV0NRK5_9TELE
MAASLIWNIGTWSNAGSFTIDLWRWRIFHSPHQFCPGLNSLSAKKVDLGFSSTLSIFNIRAENNENLDYKCKKHIVFPTLDSGQVPLRVPVSYQQKNASEFSNFKQRAVHGWEIKTTSLVFSESYSWNLFHAFILTSSIWHQQHIISVTQFILFGAAHYVKSPLSSQLQMTLGRNI